MHPGSQTLIRQICPESIYCFRSPMSSSLSRMWVTSTLCGKGFPSPRPQGEGLVLALGSTPWSSVFTAMASVSMYSQGLTLWGHRGA